MPAVCNYRKEIIDLLLPYFRKDSRYYLLVCDMGFGAIDKLKSEFPERVINCGIMEQGAVGIAAGMSMSGLIPIVYSIVNFLVYRSLEQIRNDIVLQKQNVKLISTGARDYFKFLGPSHCCGGDDLVLMKLVNMKTYDPYGSNVNFRKLFKEWITDSLPGYIRV
ncbi:MAG: hypothetical protein PHT50_00315 [Candidatus Omnitrophica bacterium]|nr:hypothetical protein [Candidatus Omnitrophota bacterium]